LRVIDALDWILWSSIILGLLSGIGLRYVFRYESFRNVSVEDRAIGLRVSSMLLLASGLMVILWIIVFTVYKVFVALGILG
jgi:hypothetical protein